MLNANKNGVYQGSRTEFSDNTISVEVLKTIDREPYEYHNDRSDVK